MTRMTFRIYGEVGDKFTQEAAAGLVGQRPDFAGYGRCLITDAELVDDGLGVRVTVEAP